jgi:hypothetical protein
MSHITPATVRGRRARQAAIARSSGVLPSADVMRRNLLDTLAGASADAEHEGAGWYLAAHSIAADMAARHGLTVAQAAGVLAALSPQCGWAENIRLADVACGEGRASGHTADACRKADAILAGADPFTVLGGRKVRSFYTNILRPTTPGPVTVDRHAVDMLCGRRGAVEDRVLERVGAYARCAAVIRGVARDLGIRPHEVQAIAWVAWRQLHDVAYRYDMEF